ncbi:hypothetical protein PFMC_03990 [Plasmodium falciparum CAMP/Malaysia]|uniref:Plasmodium falciparum erythrocyte membrane protein 1 acidic terminal segment domain-containing protein n=1 Tax=Plasmodium falciparum (isolate Camp / Malaysia) TaxID=5835 RepID=A0A024X4V6_PLAFC|nr:hypothetical protein PFMC_03990 [Plasmodium falciparum CAMP/Malaysia]
MKMRLYNNFMDLQYMVLSTVNKISDDIYYPLSNIQNKNFPYKLLIKGTIDNLNENVNF